MSPAYVSRINQLDATELDNEIYRILSARVQGIFRLLTPGVTEPWAPEINAAIRTLIWIFSLSKSQATFGQRLLDLVYADLTRKKAVLLLILSVVPKYLEDKYLDPNRILTTHTEKCLRKYLEQAANVLSILSIINLCIFLNRGTQPTILEIIVGIFSHNAATHKLRTIGYSYMTRELLWHGLMELFAIGLPMINFHSMKQCFYRLWSKHNSAFAVSPRMTKDTLCPYCKESPILPRYAGCCHVYCYYCMQAHFTAADSFYCLVCGAELLNQDMKLF